MASARVESPRRKWAIVAACAAILAGCAVYVVVETRRAMNETRESEFLKQRLMHESRGYFDRTEEGGKWIVYPPQPPKGCSDAGRSFVDAAVLALERHDPPPLGMLAEALEKDPDCVTAARMLLRFHAVSATHIKLRGRFIGRAKSEPQNAAAQVIAAFYSDYAGNSDDMKRYLEQAESVRPDQPLLHAVWGFYWSHHANPIDMSKAFSHWQREHELTGDLVSLQHIAEAYAELPDLDRARETCDRYFQLQPDSVRRNPLFACVEAVLKIGAGAAEEAWIERFRRGHLACDDGHLAYLYFQAGRPEEAVAAAERGHCPEEYGWVKGAALLQLARYPEGLAALQALGPRQRSTWYEALALALTGDTRAAIAVLAPKEEQRADRKTLIFLGLLREGRATPELLREMTSPWHLLRTAADRTAQAGCGYVQKRMFPEARKAIEAAFAEEPLNPHAWKCQIWLLSAEDNYAEAVVQGEKALAQGLRNPLFFNNLGYAYARTGDCEKALPLLEEAQRAQPTTEQIYGNLRECYEKTGRKTEAEVIKRIAPSGLDPVFWWYLAGMALGVVMAYLGVKLALIRFFPRRFGHLKFP